MALLDMTVAKVAAMISAGVTVVQFTYALALVIILIYLMRNDNSPSTWSVFVRILHYSSWPVILSTDVSSAGHADTPVKRIDLLSNIVMILVTITGVLTPLGLVPVVSQVPIDLVLHSLPDSQPLSLATTSRAQYIEERECSNGLLGIGACPGRTLTNVTGQSGLQTDLTIPPNITSVFSSTNHTSPFDMQYRRFTMATNTLNTTKLHPKPDVGIADSIILSNSLFAVDGLIIDTTDSPGVGIGKLQVPYLPHGATWNQEVLWIEPETSCVDLGFTLNFQLSSTATTLFSTNVSLTDQGGFSNFNFTYPVIGRDGQVVTMEDRAYKLAYLSNIYIMGAYNITKNASHVGKSWSVSSNFLDLMQIGSHNPDWIAYLLPPTWNYTEQVGQLDTITCEGYGGQDDANITNTAVQCSIFMGAPSRTDHGDSNLWEANSAWQQPVFACASTLRAKLQTLTVSFNSTTNATASLPTLSLERQDTNTSILWAVEHPGMNISQIDAYWGPVADEYENSSSLNTLRSDTFYLPAGISSTIGGGDTTDASAFAAYALALSGPKVSDTTTSMYDYTGKNNGAMLQLWQNLSTSAETVSKITNLIWTDIMANNIYSNISVPSTIVMQNVPTVGYNLLYAIPAFISLALWLVLVSISVAFFALDRISIQTIRQALYQTSLGRIVINITTTSANYGENTEKWITQESSTSIGLSTTNKGQSDHIQFHLVPESSSLWQVLNVSRKSIKKRKPIQQISDPMELYPLDEDSDKSHLTKS
ncbi:hypothetical protein VKS41_002256 [Umbelopsis sp. WA50703]